jgi:hypothetical protein
MVRGGCPTKAFWDASPELLNVGLELPHHVEIKVSPQEREEKIHKYLSIIGVRKGSVL